MIFQNSIVRFIAFFIPVKDMRENFVKSYSRKTKYAKLRDDNKRLFSENQAIKNDMVTLKGEIANLKRSYNQHLWELERSNCFTFQVTPLDNSPPQGPISEVFLAIACVAKNEGPYLKEWIEYHKLVGVERFYFYDNESDDNTKQILEPYIKDGTVVYHFLPNHPITKQCPQIESYNDAIFKYRNLTKWMAIIDADEFIVPVEKNSIPEFLIEYEQYPAVAINWVCFDSNGHEQRPTANGGLLTANFTRVMKDHNHGLDRTVKSIVNPKQVTNYISAHFGLYYMNFEGVTENFQRIRGMTTKFHSSNKIRINHYKSKSREEYINRIYKNSSNLTLAYKFNEDRLNFPAETTEDLVIQKYVPKLKQALGIKE